ncbi:collagen alpha-1(I) chain-like [Falco cherrug]|uniref:collagen alpha-1(I) chain-like n=1 Tax=Falco cherrug TaxID=345164 RepID=UPI002478B22D|nr:collagen alpha-1(I) chain-like [Falco cherrug]
MGAGAGREAAAGPRWSPAGGAAARPRRPGRRRPLKVARPRRTGAAPTPPRAAPELPPRRAALGGGGAGHAGSCRPPPGRGRGACPACSARARPVRPGRCPRGPGGRCGTLGGPGPVLLALPARAAGAGGLRGPQGLAAPPAATQSNVGLRGRAGLPAGPEAAPAGSAGRGGKAPAGPGARGPRRSFPAAAADREHHGSPPGRPLRGEQSGCLGAHPGPGQRGRPGTATPESCRWDEVGPCPRSPGAVSLPSGPGQPPAPGSLWPESPPLRPGPPRSPPVPPSPPRPPPPSACCKAPALVAGSAGNRPSILQDPAVPVHCTARHEALSMQQQQELVPLLLPGTRMQGAGQRTRLRPATKAGLSPGCCRPLQDAQPGAQLLPTAALGRAPKDEGV